MQLSEGEHSGGVISDQANTASAVVLRGRGL